MDILNYELSCLKLRVSRLSVNGSFLRSPHTTSKLFTNLVCWVPQMLNNSWTCLSISMLLPQQFVSSANCLHSALIFRHLMPSFTMHHTVTTRPNQGDDSWPPFLMGDGGGSTNLNNAKQLELRIQVCVWSCCLCPFPPLRELKENNQLVKNLFSKSLSRRSWLRLGQHVSQVVICSNVDNTCNT